MLLPLNTFNYPLPLEIVWKFVGEVFQGGYLLNVQTQKCRTTLFTELTYLVLNMALGCPERSCGRDELEVCASGAHRTDAAH